MIKQKNLHENILIPSKFASNKKAMEAGKINACFLILDRLYTMSQPVSYDTFASRFTLMFLNYNVLLNF